MRRKKDLRMSFCFFVSLCILYFLYNNIFFLLIAGGILLSTFFLPTFISSLYNALEQLWLMLFSFLGLCALVVIYIVVLVPIQLLMRFFPKKNMGREPLKKQKTSWEDAADSSGSYAYFQRQF